MKRLLPKEFRQAYRYLRGARVNRSFLLLSAVLATTAALLSLYQIRLLFPLVRGIITRDFSEVRSLDVLGVAVRRLPPAFSRPAALFVLLTSWVYVVNLAKNALDYLLSLLIQREALSVGQQIRVTLLDRYFSFGKLFFDRNNTAELAWQATHCQAWISDLFVAFQSLLSNLLQLAVFLLIMTVVSWQLTLAVLLALPLFQLSRLLVSRIRAHSRQHLVLLKDLHAHLTQTLAFLTLVRTSGKAASERANFLRLSADEAAAAYRMHRMTGLVNPVLELTGTTALLFMAVCLSMFVAAGALDSARIFVFFFLVLRTVPLLIGMTRLRTVVAEQTAAAESFDQLMNDHDKHIVPSGRRLFTGVFERIEIRNLNFGYVPDRVILRDMNLRIPQGKLIGVIGATGVGKTTLMNLLFRFYDCPAGAIFIDGVDIREFELDSLRAHMALVSQDAIILQDTLRANLAYSAPRPPTDEDLAGVLEKAALTDFISSLPKGLDTVVGERGARLSGGEKQRIAIARAFLRNAPILVMDEPTNALDAKTERLIAQATREVAAGRTTIVIAHRMSTIRFADTIVVLEEGRVTQHGTPQELAIEPGPYRDFISEQMPTGPTSSAA